MPILNRITEGFASPPKLSAAAPLRHGRAFVPAIHALVADAPADDKNASCRVAGSTSLTNRPNGTLYVGVTSDLARRIWEHRADAADGFTRRYGLKRLVYVERHDDIRTAIQREKNMKHWPRAWKVRLILGANPAWDDLYDRVV